MTVDYLPPPRELPDARLEELRAELELFAATDRVGRRRPSWWARRGFVLGAGIGIVVAASGGTALAIALMHPAPVTNVGYARCYSVATYKSGAHFPGTTIAEPTSATAAGRVLSAVDTCSALWRAGIVQAGRSVAVARPDKSAYPVPALVGCTLPNGVAAVFPGDVQTCERLGLAAELPAAMQSAQPLPSSAIAGAGPS